MEAATLPRQPVSASRRRRALGARSRPDDILVEAVRAGDPRAFELLYDRHYRGLLAFCRHMLGGREEAEDAVQQVFLSAFSQVREGTPPARFQPWLYAVARNRCLSVLRARREHENADEHPLATEGLQEAVQRRADLRSLLGDLAGLPDDQRAALVLAELGDLSHLEIAQVLGCPAPKVKALVFQAREALIGARRARETDCREVRETLATATGGVLRRAPLRRHLKLCAGCRAFRQEVAMQRSALALVLPVVPTLALKQASLGGAGAAAGGAAATGGLGGLGSGMAAKLGVVVALAGGGAGTVVAVRALEHHGAARGSAGVRPGAAETPRLAPSLGPVVGRAQHSSTRHHRRARAHHRPSARPLRRSHPARAPVATAAPVPVTRSRPVVRHPAPSTRSAAAAPKVRRPRVPKIKIPKRTSPEPVTTKPVKPKAVAPAPVPVPIVTGHGHAHGHGKGHDKHGGGDGHGDHGGGGGGGHGDGGDSGGGD